MILINKTNINKLQDILNKISKKSEDDSSMNHKIIVADSILEKDEIKEEKETKIKNFINKTIEDTKNIIKSTREYIKTNDNINANKSVIEAYKNTLSVDSCLEELNNYFKDEFKESSSNFLGL